jgi:hypothetical protein
MPLCLSSFSFPRALLGSGLHSCLIPYLPVPLPLCPRRLTTISSQPPPLPYCFPNIPGALGGLEELRADEDEHAAGNMAVDRVERVGPTGAESETRGRDRSAITKCPMNHGCGPTVGRTMVREVCGRLHTSPVLWGFHSGPAQGAVRSGPPHTSHGFCHGPVDSGELLLAVGKSSKDQ